MHKNSNPNIILHFITDKIFKYAEYLTLARQNHCRVPFYATIQDEDSEETGEDVTRDDSWNYADILWNGIRADAVQAAFDRLSFKEQTFDGTSGGCRCSWCGGIETDREKQKIAAAAYEYKAVHRYANDDDEWGEIRFDFSAGTAQIVKLADGDLSRTNVYAKIAIRQILKFSISELPKKLTIPFELEMERIRYGS